MALLVRFEAWDPERAVAADRHNGISVAANVYVDVPDGAVMVGLLYDVVLPEDSNAAFTNDAHLQRHFTF